ncbi:hypothetical protein BIW11_02770 [Tropilaelaps mercedesae]|uniref:Uncharacterized protein n=1 Tax=Tropilaelaps mercedesae TaxID=418985 RepID=A0A1V9XXQ4_9ACAR|nr:hypothetical protein BIW11_02770 [Tropilaelaps mercedesae]
MKDIFLSFILFVVLTIQGCSGPGSTFSLKQAAFRSTHRSGDRVRGRHLSHTKHQYRTRHQRGLRGRQLEPSYPGEDAEPIKLTVVITAGSFHERIRKLSIIIRGINSTQINEAVINVYSNKSDMKDLTKTIVLRESISQLDGTSILVMTDLEFAATRWTPTDFPRTSLFFSELVIRDMVVADGSLTVEPSWIANAIDKLGWITLFDLALPGTHQSGAYRRYDRYDVQNTNARLYYYQEEDVFTQLLYGIRSLDFRLVAIVKETEQNKTYEYWISSEESSTGHQLEPILKDINAFLLIFKLEVVFIDFIASFSTDAEYEGLAELVNRTFGELLYPRRPLTKLQYVMRQRLYRVIEANHRVIVTYRHHKRTQEFNLPGVRHIRPRSADLNQLRHAPPTL